MKFPNPQALEKSRNSQLSQLMQEAEVKNYLLNHPDFLKNNPQLLAHLEIAQTDEGVTSLVERQIKVLRERNQVMQGQLIDMLHAAHNNEALLIQCNQFMLDLLKADSLQSLNRQIIQLLKQEFELDGVALLLVGNYQNAAPAQVYSSTDKIKSILNCQFPDSQPLCGRLESEPKIAIFGELSSELSSFALIPLGEGCSAGILVLASRDVNRFEPEMGTLFVELIAKLITHLTRRYVSV